MIFFHLRGMKEEFTIIKENSHDVYTFKFAQQTCLFPKVMFALVTSYLPIIYG